jgi:hypothetical protein
MSSETNAGSICNDMVYRWSRIALVKRALIRLLFTAEMQGSGVILAFLSRTMRFESRDVRWRDSL